MVTVQSFFGLYCLAYVMYWELIQTCTMYDHTYVYVHAAERDVGFMPVHSCADDMHMCTKTHVLSTAYDCTSVYLKLMHK